MLHPLAVAPSPALTEPVEALQKRFLAVAREKSGYVLSLRREVEDALGQVGPKDFARSDDALGRLATAAKVQNGLHVTLQLTAKGELALSGRVVKANGERLRTASVTVPRAAGSLLDALAGAAGVFFEALKRGTAPVAEAPPVVVKPVENEPPPPVEVKPAPVVTPVQALVSEAPAPGSPLRTVGFIVAGVGAATAIAGGVVFATAGTVQQDPSTGNIALGDAPRVEGIRAQQAAGVAVLAAGGGVALVGAVLALVAPSAPVKAGLAPNAHGATLVLEGRF